jgi:DNA-binding NarL/FixJ family response regulator
MGKHVEQAEIPPPSGQRIIADSKPLGSTTARGSQHDANASTGTKNVTTAVVKLLVADDHRAILDAVTQYVSLEDDIELVGTAADGEEALRLVEQRRPDVALLDIKMPKLGGIEVLQRLAGTEAPPAVILYTGYPERGLLLEALDVGARGFLLKESVVTDLMRAVRAVADGGTYIDPELASVLASPEAAEKLIGLTKREREILRLLADGMRNQEVGTTLFISPLTVATHVQHAMTKLEADTRTQAVASALRKSLIS